MKKLFLYILCLAAFSQCNKIQEIGQGDNAVFIDEAQPNSSFQVAIPAGTTTKALNITPKLVYLTGQNTDITVGVAPELIDSYNKKNNTDYVVVPSANYTLAKTTTTIPANSSAATPLQIVFSKTDTLTRAHKYLLPVTITTISNGLSAIPATKTIYYIVDNSVLISTAAVLTNNYFTPAMAGTANASMLSGLTQFTMETLVNVNAFRDGGDAGISSVMGIEGYLLMRFGDAGIGNNVLQLATASGNIASSISVNAKKWTHLAVTYDGTTVKMYIDGVLAASQAKALGTITFIPAGKDPFYIGRSYNDNRPLDGAISECRIWNVARTVDQLGGDNKYKVDPTSAGLLCYWKFNEGSGNAAHDYTGHGFDATAKNPASWVAVKLP
jgi:hypothetical protein